MDGIARPPVPFGMSWWGQRAATDRAWVPASSPRVTSSIATDPQTQRRYRIHPCDVWCVDSTVASSLGQPHRVHRMAVPPSSNMRSVLKAYKTSVPE
jgi:hypothetical protein